MREKTMCHPLRSIWVLRNGKCKEGLMCASGLSKKECEKYCLVKIIPSNPKHRATNHRFKTRQMNLFKPSTCVTSKTVGITDWTKGPGEHNDPPYNSMETTMRTRRTRRTRKTTRSPFYC
ncbi:uncharacterized protein Dana_GF26260 [Drosophila ananassae]|uniref:Uncharacterized protein n=1 Tax=Drosophila ananassae TaxID=7217 RepID=A0A0P8XMW0_DROAN|nr:uncharacterized protein Dana_GF26260 [Drosophila ananassae]